MPRHKTKTWCEKTKDQEKTKTWQRRLLFLLFQFQFFFWTRAHCLVVFCPTRYPYPYPCGLTFPRSVVHPTTGPSHALWGGSKLHWRWLQLERVSLALCCLVSFFVFCLLFWPCLPLLVPSLTLPYLTLPRFFLSGLVWSGCVVPCRALSYASLFAK